MPEGMTVNKSVPVLKKTTPVFARLLAIGLATGQTHVFNMALTEARDRYSLYRKGIVKLYDLIDVGQRVLTAQADLAQSPEERADVLQKQLEIFAEAEDNLEKQIKEGKAENADLDHLRYERLGVEIDLEILRRGMAE